MTGHRLQQLQAELQVSICQRYHKDQVRPLPRPMFNVKHKDSLLVLGILSNSIVKLIRLTDGDITFILIFKLHCPRVQARNLELLDITVCYIKILILLCIGITKIKMGC